MKSEMKKYLTLGIILAGVLAVSIIIYFCIGKQGEAWIFVHPLKFAQYDHV